MAISTNPSHPWKFTSLGGFSQARMETAADFANLGTLDQKLWAALACPVKGLAFDTRTLGLLDHDNDGRIRAPEVIEASRWCSAMLTSLDALAAGDKALSLAHIDQSSPEGAGLYASAKRILEELGQNGTTLSVAGATKAAEMLAASPLNGDGVVHAGSTDVEAVQTLIGEIVGSLGGVADRGGEMGVDQGMVDTFYADAQAALDWTAGGTPDVLVLGPGTGAAADAVTAVQRKVDDFFARCRLANFDDRALVALNRKEEEYLAIAAEDLSVTAEEVSGFPLARIEACRDLPLVGPVNPAWAARLLALKASAVGPLLGAELEVLTEEAWTELKTRLAPFHAWKAARPASGVTDLAADRLQALIEGPEKAALAALIAEDAALAPTVAAVAQVERLVRFHRDLCQLARNFVNFTDFYSDTARATFEAGTLYLDGRACQLVVRVDDPGKHAALAARSKLFLAYCNCTRPSGEKLAIAAAFTDGDADFLMVGRNGVFYDRDGKDWDATITKIVDNPISIRQAFWAPYKKLASFFEERAAKEAAAKEAESEKQRMATAKGVVGDGDGKPAAPKIDVGMAAAIAVGLGALGSMMVALLGYVTGLFALPFWIICVVLMAIFIGISLPSVAMAYFKLRQRSLGPILDSNGWAVNGSAKLSVRFGGTMTDVAELPPGSRVDTKDQYADPVNPWPGMLKTVVAVCFLYSLLNWFGVVHMLSKGKIGDEASDMRLFPATEAPAEVEAPAAAPAPAPAPAPAK